MRRPSVWLGRLLGTLDNPHTLATITHERVHIPIQRNYRRIAGVVVGSEDSDGGEQSRYRASTTKNSRITKTVITSSSTPRARACTPRVRAWYS